MTEAHRPLNKYLLNEFTFRSHIQELRIPGGSDGKEPACHVGDLGLIPGLGRSPGEGNGNLLQYSGLENSMDYISMGPQRSDRLSDFHMYLTPRTNRI